MKFLLFQRSSFSVFLLFLLFIFLISSCDTTDPNPPEEKPPGYQEDIPWPSLADSPWPMYHGDPQSTGRSRYTGPTQGVVSNVIPASQMQAGIIIGYNSTIYYTASGTLFSSDFAGRINWELKLASEISCTPLMGNDSTIYVYSGSEKKIFAINNDGTIEWEYEAADATWNASLGIDKDGNIYFVMNSTLFVLSKNGELLWELFDSRFLSNPDDTFPFSPDGNTIYLQGHTTSLIAVDIKTHNVIWDFGDREMKTGAIVDNEGNIYIFPSSVLGKENYFYSLTPTGEIRWKFKHEENDFMLDNAEPAIDKEGNIYFGFHNLYSLDYFGNLRWKVNLEGSSIGSSILVDNIGNIFIGTHSDNSYDLNVFAFDNTGLKIWGVLINSERVLGTSAAIAENGVLLYPTFRSDNYYIIK